VKSQVVDREGVNIYSIV